MEYPRDHTNHLFIYASTSKLTKCSSSWIEGNTGDCIFVAFKMTDQNWILLEEKKPSVVFKVYFKQSPNLIIELLKSINQSNSTIKLLVPQESKTWFAHNT